MKYDRLTMEKEYGCGLCHDRKCKKPNLYCKDRLECEIYNRLAELEDKIEQGTLKEEKTCKNVSEMHPVDGFTCSECGISLVDYVEERVDEEECDVTYHEYEIKYCPNCGAKVVEE